MRFPKKIENNEEWWEGRKMQERVYFERELWQFKITRSEGQL